MTNETGMVPAKPERTLETVAAEIRTFTAGMLNNIIEIGRRMVEAKEMLPYGQFGTWIRENTGYSDSTAENFMRLYMEYGDMQGSLFGADVKSQTFGKLTYSKALALLAVPAGEREAFIRDTGAEDMSVRELRNAIRERDEARKTAEDERARADAAEESRVKMESDMAALKKIHAGSLRDAQSALDEADHLRRELMELKNKPVEVAVETNDKAVRKAREEAAAEMRGQLDEANRAADEAKEKAAALRKELNELKKSLPDDQVMEETVRAATEKAVAEVRAQLDKAKEDKKKADEKRKAAEQALADMKSRTETEVGEIREQLALAQAEAKKAAAENDKDIASFAAWYDQAKDIVNRMHGVLMKINLKDPETAVKLANAMNKLGETIMEAAK